MYGLLGKVLVHSFSPKIHNQIGDYQYDLIEKQEDEAREFIKSRQFSGLNVTMPYKRTVMEYCDELSDTVGKTKCINTIVNRDGKLYGDNTDYYGMNRMFERADIQIKDKVVLILGDGATSDTATALLKDIGAKEIIKASRNSDIKLDDYAKFQDVQVIINCTPVGMFPNNYKVPTDIDQFPNLEAVCDVVYNPFETRLIMNAKKKGLKTSDGLVMLVAQAIKAAELFTGKTYDHNSLEDNIIKIIKKNAFNIVIIGMPGSGKTTVGEEIAELSGKKFIDIDRMIIEEVGNSIPYIFEEYGEAFFREKESEIISRVAKDYQLVISTGGGCILNSENYYSLKQNSRIYYIERELEDLSTHGRPLSAGGLKVLKELYKVRYPLYKDFADVEIKNETIDETAKEIWREFDENINN